MGLKRDCYFKIKAGCNRICWRCSGSSPPGRVHLNRFRFVINCHENCIAKDAQAEPLQATASHCVRAAGPALHCIRAVSLLKLTAFSCNEASASHRDARTQAADFHLAGQGVRCSTTRSREQQCESPLPCFFRMEAVTRGADPTYFAE